MRNTVLAKISFIVYILLFSPFVYCADLADPLSSWNDGVVKQSIISFVKSVTDKSSPDYVAPENRIATIDNDGTLWVEQPMYTQEIFIKDRFKEMLTAHPELKQQALYKSIIANPTSPKSLETIFAITSSNMTVEEFNTSLKKWFATVVNPHFQHHYPELIYQPMLEVIHYLNANQFVVYIVSGGGQDFIRAFATNAYGIPVERVIGSTEKTEYTYKNGKPQLVRLAKPLYISDHAGKPEAINLFIGKKPIIAIGNSVGDQQMLEWTQTSPGKTLMLLVHHDDAKREYAYDTTSKIGTFSEALFTEAKKNNWHIISMKDDWKVIFPYELKQ